MENQSARKKLSFYVYSYESWTRMTSKREMAKPQLTHIHSHATMHLKICNLKVWCDVTRSRANINWKWQKRNEGNVKCQQIRRISGVFSNLPVCTWLFFYHSHSTRMSRKVFPSGKPTSASEKGRKTNQSGEKKQRKGKNWNKRTKGIE